MARFTRHGPPRAARIRFFVVFPANQGVYWRVIIDITVFPEVSRMKTKTTATHRGCSPAVRPGPRSRLGPGRDPGGGPSRVPRERDRRQEPAAQTVPGSFGMALDPGDEVRTGADSQAEVHFDNGHWVQIGPNSSTQVHGAKTASPAAGIVGG